MPTFHTDKAITPHSPFLNASSCECAAEAFIQTIKMDTANKRNAVDCEDALKSFAFMAVVDYDNVK